MSDGFGDGAVNLSLADGACGEALGPAEWHAALDTVGSVAASSDAEGPLDASAAASGFIRPVVLDCRNAYESDIGRFSGAVPLNTDTYRDTWQQLGKLLAETPKDTPILTYCTVGPPRAFECTLAHSCTERASSHLSLRWRTK